MELNILINNIKADITNQIDLNITYQVSDIRNIGKNNSSYSKTISFPGTQINNNIFKNIFDVNNQSEFDPSKKADIKVYSGGLLIFEGILKLDSILILKDREITYECTAYSNINDIFVDLGKSTLDELDLSEYNHQYTKDNVIGSWDSFIIKNGVRSAFSKGDGYVYPYIDYGFGHSTNNKKTLEFFRPSIYAKTILDKIFNKVGYSYQSEFFNSDYFKSLIITPSIDGNYYSSDKLDKSKLKASLKEVNPSNIISIGTSYNSPELLMKFDDDSTNGNYDNGNNYNNNTNKYLVNTNGRYRILANVNVANAFGDPSFSVGSAIFRTFACDIDYIINIYKTKNNVPTLLDTFTQTRKFSQSLTINFTTSTPTPLVCDSEIDLEIGDEIYVVTLFRVKNAKMFNSSSQQVTFGIQYKQLTPSSFNVELVNTPIFEGEDYNFNEILPNELCVDFISSINKMFNLVWEPNKINGDKNFTIEPRKDFYNGSVIDWTYKFDRDSECEIIPISEINDKNLSFEYTEDNDYYNDNYQNRYFETYAKYTYEIDNDFVDKTSINETKLLFSPTPLVSERANNMDTGNIISTIYKIENDIPSPLYDTNLRILFYTGLKDTNSLNITTKFGGDYSGTKYPYAGYLDDPKNPTQDLNFWFPKQYYYNRQILTNSNLFNKYWSDFINDLYSKESKLFIGDFYLNTNDIYSFSFRNIIYFERKYWIVNKILDYNPIINTKTRIELLSINNYGVVSDFVNVDEKFINLNNSVYLINNDKNNAIKFVESSKDLFTSNIIKGVNNTVSKFNNYSNILIGDNNLFGANSFNNLVSGSGNTIGGGSEALISFGDNNQLGSGGKKTIMIGDNNISDDFVEKNFLFGDNNIVTGTSKAFIFGDNNTVSGATNTFVIGSGLTVNQSDSTFINTTNLIINSTGITYGSTASTITYQEVTYTQLTTDLIPNNLLNPGVIYNIDTEQTTWKDKGIFLQAISQNELSNIGSRLFLAPGEYNAQTDGFGNVWLGIWNSSLTPSIGELVIWGGRVWSNVNGLVGTSIDDFTLDTEWQVIDKDSFTNNEYIPLKMIVEYDITNNWVETQIDKNNNRIGVSYDNWSYNSPFSYNPVDISDWNYNVSNTFFGNDIKYGFYNNFVAACFNNKVTGGIFGNDLQGIHLISSNLMNGYISDIKYNTNQGDIYHNIINFNIESNSNDTYISNNSNIGDIKNNSNSGSIEKNSNLGEIRNNSNTGSIIGNSNNGDIFDNSNTNDIANNSNNGGINSNDANISDISFNQNNGYIDNNTGTGGPWKIWYNQNNGFISTTATADVEDTIVDKT